MTPERGHAASLLQAAVGIQELGAGEPHVREVFEHLDQGVEPRGDLVAHLGQRLHVELAREAEREGDVVGGIVGSELRQKPHPLLREGEDGGARRARDHPIR